MLAYSLNLSSAHCLHNGPHAETVKGPDGPAQIQRAEGHSNMLSIVLLTFAKPGTH